jgi:4-amino-4-deoxy-L-arabinose transferase-like glycosyltransferase
MRPEEDRSRSSPRAFLRPSDLAGLLAVVALGYVVPPFERGLWNPDEPRVAHIGWDMLSAGGDLVVPRVNGEPLLQEPPLVHWLVALTYRLTGARPGDAFAPRVPSVAASLLAILAVGSAARRRWGSAAGFLAALTLASTAEFLEIGNRAGTDMLSTLFVTVGGIQVLEISSEKAIPWRRALVLGLSFGLAFLAKNLLGPVFLAAVIAAVLLARRDLLRAPSTWAAAALFLAAALLTTLPWLVLLGREDPSFPRQVLGHIFGRASEEGIHDPNLFEFSGRVLLDMLPWTPLLLPAVWALVRGSPLGRRRSGRRDGIREAPGEPASLALLAWIFLPVLIILVSRSKRDLYLLAIYPALALALGRSLGNLIEAEKLRRPAAILVILLALPLPAAALLGGPWVSPLPGALFAASAVHLYFLYRWIRERGWRSPARSAITAALLLGLAVTSGNLLRYRIEDPRRTYRPMAEEIVRLDSAGFRVLGFRLGLKGASTTAYCLGKRFTNLKEIGEAEGAIDPGAPPTALVVEGDGEAQPAASLGERAAAKLDFPVKKGPFRIYLNRALRGG